MGTGISHRALNRTLLDRQFLLSRVSLSTLGVIERLVALQAREPNWPYVGLWTGVADCRHGALMSLLSSGQVVRAASLRSTQNLMASLFPPTTLPGGLVRASTPKPCVSSGIPR
ncbi:MAG: crosslink repair DNA glycosylase YcaQ family protein [Acidimicrobiia bacterium]